MFDSWDSPRAQVYRRTYDIPDDLGTAVNVVQMVFGNKGDTLRARASASRATRRPASAVLYGEFLVNAQGEDVVAGIRTPEPIERMRERLPEAYDQLVATLERLEEHYRDDAGHRVHGRGGRALPAPDAHRQAHGAGGAARSRSRWPARS